MSSTSTVNATSSSVNFQSIFSAALKAYEKQTVTKRDLLAHPLASQLQTCDSTTSVLAVLHRQVEDLDQARKSDENLTKWLNPTVNVLLAFSAMLGEGVCMVSSRVILFSEYVLIARTQVFSPAKVIFAGAGVLLQVCVVRHLATEPNTKHFRQSRTSTQLRRP